MTFRAALTACVPLSVLAFVIAPAAGYALALVALAVAVHLLPAEPEADRSLQDISAELDEFRRQRDLAELHLPDDAAVIADMLDAACADLPTDSLAAARDAIRALRNGDLYLAHMALIAAREAAPADSDAVDVIDRALTLAAGQLPRR